MTKFNTKTSAELKLDAEAAQLSLNSALAGDSYSDITKKRDELKKAVSDYNQKAKAENFAILRASDNPMMAAIEQLTYGTMTTREEKDKETKIVTRHVLEAGFAYIDLLEFEKFCEGKTIAVNTAWKFKIEKFNFVMALRIAKELKQDVKTVERRFNISEEAMGVDSDNRPISNTKILSRLQDIVDAIIYEDKDGKNRYKVKSHDVAYLILILASPGKDKHGVKYPNASTMRAHITRMINRIVEDGSYTLEYITKREAEVEANAKAKAEAELESKTEAKVEIENK